MRYLSCIKPTPKTLPGPLTEQGTEQSCGPAHLLPETGRRGQPEPEGGNCGLREASSTKLQAGFIANQDFLEFWMVNIHQEGHNQRAAPQKTHTAHLRRCTGCTPGKLSGWDGGGDKMQPPTGGDCARQTPNHLSCSDLGRAQNACPTKSVPLWSTQEPEPEQLRPGKYMQPSDPPQTVPDRAT